MRPSVLLLNASAYKVRLALAMSPHHGQAKIAQHGWLNTAQIYLEVQDDVLRIRLQLPDQLPEPLPDQVPVQASQHLPGHLPGQRQLQQMTEPIVTQIPVSWTVTENELRDTLSQHQSHRVLHMTDMGHVILKSYRGWDRRRSHASLDRWRFLLFASVH